MATELVKSAARALEVMEAFAAERRRLTASQLGERLDYPRSSLNVLLRSLVAQGYLSCDPRDQSFHPTLKLAELGAWVPGALLATEPLLAELRALRDRTGETVTLTLPAGSTMRVASVYIGTAPIAAVLSDGTTFPIKGTAVGAAFLSALPVHETKRVAAKLWTDATELERALETFSVVRERGFAVAYDSVVPDTGALAAPIATSAELLVIAVAGLNSRIRRHEAALSRALLDTVKRLSVANSRSRRESVTIMPAAAP